MSDEQPQLYLLTPTSFDPEPFVDQLSKILDKFEVACLRLPLSGTDEYALGKAADACRLVAHERDIAVVIDTHIALAERHGLDGVHLLDGARSIRVARETLGTDAIVGSYCGVSRHEGMSAGESGADYVSFGPVGTTALGSGSQAEGELFEWWSQMIEVPIVAEGALNVEMVNTLAPHTDFFAVGDEIWGAEDPLAALTTLLAPLA